MYYDGARWKVAKYTRPKKYKLSSLAVYTETKEHDIFFYEIQAQGELIASKPCLYFNYVRKLKSGYGKLPAFSVLQFNRRSSNKFNRVLCQGNLK